VQFLTDARGRLLWTSAALPGSVHDLAAARTHGTPNNWLENGGSPIETEPSADHPSERVRQL
jgi:hypothetical protein